MDILTFIYYHHAFRLHSVFRLHGVFRKKKKSFSWNPASLSCDVLANGALASSLCAEGNVSFACTPQDSPTGRTKVPPVLLSQQCKENKQWALLPMKGGWLWRDGQQTKPESAVFLAANQSPVLWRVAHKKQSGKRETRYFPVCRGCRGKSTRGTRDCSESTDERLSTTVWPNRPSTPPYIYGHMSTHVWREEDLDLDLDSTSVWASFRGS